MESKQITVVQFKRELKKALEVWAEDHPQYSSKNRWDIKKNAAYWKALFHGVEIVRNIMFENKPEEDL